MRAEDEKRTERGADHGVRVYPREDPQAAREQMVRRHLGLARQLALRYSDSGEPLEDLVQVASLALVKAVDRFDPTRGVAFSTFAVPTIRGELRRHFRDRGWAVHVPRDLKEAAVRVRRAIGQHNGPTPTTAELAQATGLSVEEVLEALEAAGARRALSLDAPAGSGLEEEDAATWHELLGAEDEGFARARERATLARLQHVLGDREREILRLRFEEGLTQSEIGARIGVSQMQVSRLIRAALTRLRASVGHEDPA